MHKPVFYESPTVNLLPGNYFSGRRRLIRGKTVVNAIAPHRDMVPGCLTHAAKRVGVHQWECQTVKRRWYDFKRFPELGYTNRYDSLRALVAPRHLQWVRQTEIVCGKNDPWHFSSLGADLLVVAYDRKFGPTDTGVLMQRVWYVTTNPDDGLGRMPEGCVSFDHKMPGCGLFNPDQYIRTIANPLSKPHSVQYVSDFRKSCAAERHAFENGLVWMGGSVSRWVTPEKYAEIIAHLEEQAAFKRRANGGC